MKTERKRKATTNVAADNGPIRASTRKTEQHTRSSSSSPTQHPKDRYFFFYGKDSPFSNFFPASFTDDNDNNTFFCTEQYIMYHKAVLFGDKDMAEAILQERTSPRRCKQLGRKVGNFSDAVWIAHARDIVQRGLWLKFTANPQLGQVLLDTGNVVELVEAAPRDRRWGIGYGAKKAMMVPKEKWGSNWLGEALMITRAKLGAVHKEDTENGDEVVNDDGDDASSSEGDKE